MRSIEELNAAAWDEEVSRHNWWTIPADEEKMAEARKGHPEISLGPEKKLPDSWTGLIGKRVLALASGGGQQGPLLAASGRDVVVFDISQKQLEQDRAAARKYSLRLETVRGDMADLSVFGSASFDTVINPVSLNFTAHIAQVISEVVRVLKPGGHFMLSIANPVMYIFDVPALERGKMKIRYTLPFSSGKSLSERQRARLASSGGTFEFSHTLDSVLGGLLHSGLVLLDYFSEKSGFEPVDSFIQDCYMTMLLLKPDDLS